MRTRLRHAPAIVAAIVQSAAVAGAQPVIDSFETGNVSLSASATTASQTVTVSSPGHALASTRTVTLTPYVPTAGISTVNLTAWTVADDEITVALGVGGGQASLEWDPAALVDLTDNGLNDRIDLHFSAYSAGGSVEIFLLESDGGGLIHTVPINETIKSLRFDSAPYIAFESIDLIRVTVFDSTSAVYRLRDIRAMRADSFRSKFDAMVATVIGPPYPVPPVIFQVSDQAGVTDEAHVTLVDATTIAGWQPDLLLGASDSGGPVGGFGESAVVDCDWNSGMTWRDTAFEMSVEILDGVAGVPPDPILGVPPTPIVTSSGFLLSFEVLLQDEIGRTTATSRRQLHFDVPEGQGVALQNVAVLPMAAAGSSGPQGFRVTFDAVDDRGVDTAVKLFEVTMNGSCQPSPATASPLANPATDAATFRALPSVTRSGSLLRLARPASSGGSIGLFDVSGRLLRTLRVPAGGTGARWDGRDDAGHPTAAGVYFARFTDGRRPLVARVVRVR